MAFTFVVETGTGDPDANSYTSVEFADDYISGNSFASVDWFTKTDAEKEKLLVRASKYLDNIIHWNGLRMTDESGLRWPRSGVFDADSFEIPDDMIPIILQEAVCELATYLMTDDWTAPQGTRGFTKLQVDVIEIDFNATMTRGSLPDSILAMLAGIGGLGTSGRRPAFKKIVRS